MTFRCRSIIERVYDGNIKRVLSEFFFSNAFRLRGSMFNFIGVLNYGPQLKPGAIDTTSMKIMKS